MLERIAEGKKKVLIIIAPEVFAHQTYSDVKSRNLLGSVLFGYMTWQKVFDALKEIVTDNPFERLIIDDLIKLLCQKGFESFRNFCIDCSPINADNAWTFDYSLAQDFNFVIAQKLERSQHYEFR